MARLPIPGKDNGTWGSILNDFLAQSHNNNGTLSTTAVNANHLSTGGTTGDVLVRDTSAADGMRWQAVAAAGSTVTLTGDVTGPSNANTLATNAVTTAKIADGSVTSAKIADGTITTADLANGIITAAKIASGTITTATLADGLVTAPKLATTGAPTSGQVLSYNGSSLAWTTPAAAPTTPDATTTSKGIVQLAGDLAGTAAAPTVPGLAGKVNTSSLGQANGVATLDGTGKVPASQLPAPSGGTQVNSDWTATSGVAQILNKPTLATVATSGSYTDLTNKPTIPAAQVQSDWNATTGVSAIANKPTLSTVATSGSYTDLSNTPTIPTALSGLSDVTMGTPSDGQVLTYSAGTSKWAPMTASGGAASIDGGKWVIKDYTTGSYPTVNTTYYPNPGELIYFLGSPSANVSIVLPATATLGDRVGILRHTKSDADKYSFPDVKKSDTTMLLRRVAPYEMVIFEWRGDWVQATTGSLMDPAPSTAAQDTTPILAVRAIQPRPQAPIHKPDNKIHKWTSVPADFTLSMSGDTSSGTPLTASATSGYGFNGGTTALNSIATGTRTNNAVMALASPINLTGRALYIIMSMTNTGTGSLGGFSIAVSNSSSFTNAMSLSIDHQKILFSQYHYTGGNQWTTLGTGADLSAVTHVRITWTFTNLTSNLYVAGIGSYKPFSKSAVVLCLDGVPSNKFDAGKEFPVWATKGVKGVVFPGIVNELPTRWQRRLTDQGWEFGIRSLMNSSKGGLEAEGLDLVRETQEFVDSCAKAGIAKPVVAGQWTNVGSMNANTINMETMRQYVSGFRRYLTYIPTQRCLWPPVEPMNIPSYGLATLASAQAMIQDAISNPGTLVVFTFHTLGNYINEVIDYCKPYFDDGTLLNLTFSEALITGPRDLLATPVTGSRGSGAALQSLISVLAMQGIIKDDTTA